MLIGHRVAYFRCPACGYLQTEKPYWLDEAYAVPINLSDTGIMARNLYNRSVVATVVTLLGKPRGKVIDFAGGYGVLVRLLRDFGIDAYWMDGYCENKLAAGFEHSAGVSYDLLTAFEVFEHLIDPRSELERMLALSPNVLISTEFAPTNIPDDWWYFGREHGQHIGFFTIDSLQRLAGQSGKHVLSNGRNYHLITDSKVSPAAFKAALRWSSLIAPVLKRRYTTRVHSDHLLMASDEVS
ncbi:class I SAM-dependent methyltransferase [Sphingomonas sp. BT-65]|uniref:class I SAM-dependent methyltransferase n=1 Tax=Sphingomonas sp. BT-65 TaxID=2989821 RepID=UPI002235B7CD|nr:class I SAM-dependent methyltransferase [Sphingomonas sp. BT-65]MCW4461897.1 class I SAM-dependent methyltransferase [Sphingomonas sp. BT-65]